MRRALLDINVLLALLDADHVDHVRSHAWLGEEIAAGWASCPITENGFVRIISQPRYPSPISPGQAVALLRGACRTAHHEFWPCEISLLDEGVIEHACLHRPRQITDAYLLAVAVRNGGRLVTFDRHVPISAVPSAEPEHLLVL